MLEGFTVTKDFLEKTSFYTFGNVVMQLLKIIINLETTSLFLTAL